MLISKLIADLEEAKAKHGDVPVKTPLDDGTGDPVPHLVKARDGNTFLLL